MIAAPLVLLLSVILQTVSLSQAYILETGFESDAYAALKQHMREKTEKHAIEDVFLVFMWPRIINYLPIKIAIPGMQYADRVSTLNMCQTSSTVQVELSDYIPAATKHLEGGEMIDIEVYAKLHIMDPMEFTLFPQERHRFNPINVRYIFPGMSTVRMVFRFPTFTELIPSDTNCIVILKDLEIVKMGSPIVPSGDPRPTPLAFRVMVRHWSLVGYRSHLMLETLTAGWRKATLEKLKSNELWMCLHNDFTIMAQSPDASIDYYRDVCSLV